MNIEYYINLFFAIIFFIISFGLLFTGDSWEWTGPLALAFLFMNYMEENSDR